tara:strand:- start:248 stop:742 length:495 start_codon:yes stop_codon:yes gene_type:complete
MNSTQRKFLVERIQSKVKGRIEALKNSLLDLPSIDNYIFKAIMTDDLELQPSDVILSALKRKAARAKAGENWLSDDRMGMYKNTTIRFDVNDLIKLPKDYNNELTRAKEHNSKIHEEISLLKIQLDTIEVRIQLASDKTLQSLINEVDDMGDIKLIETNLKLLQ